LGLAKETGLIVIESSRLEMGHKMETLSEPERDSLGIASGTSFKAVKETSSILIKKSVR
jgi:hypothetical protein